MALEHNFTFIFKDNDGNLRIMYPKTVAKQVLTNNGENLADHINSNELHLLASEKKMLSKPNQPGGLTVLDDKGLIPLDVIDQSYVAIRVEFANATALTTDGANIKPGTLVMVNDASDDPRVGLKSWAIYRRTTNSTAYNDLDKGWSVVNTGASMDLSSDWKAIGAMPISEVADIDDAVQKRHSHANKVILDKFTLEDDGTRPSYDGHNLIFDEEISKIHQGDYLDDEDFRNGDFWLKPSYAQTWWGNNTIEDAGASCYEKYREQDTMVEAPKVRTHDTTSMCRMFYKCYDLTDVPQYDTVNVIDFTGMFAECTSLKTVPIMGTASGKTFDNMFYKCSSLEYSPEMTLQNAESVIGMYSGCSNMTRVLPFGSTAKITNMKQWFNGCTSLRRITTPIDFSAVEDDNNVVNMFNECIDLEDLNFVENSLHVSLSLANTNLSLESLLGILQGLPVTQKENTLTLSGIPALADLDQSEIQSAIDKGWNIVTTSATV